ncbi:MAG: WG repeat-containing protein [Candidatus Obscuribacterales bacterium]|nr:WG repeat-containing protein [Candidatus Obscuribacterales bacterium]
MNGLAKLLAVFLCSFMVEPSTPDGLLSCDGNPVGLCDLQKREILAPRFSSITYVGNGIFLALSRNEEDRFEYGNDRRLFNSDGKELKVTLPQGCDLMQVFWLGEKAERIRDLPLAVLPNDAMFRFRSSQKFGLCDANGKIILPAVYGFIGKVADGKAFVSDNVLATSGEEGLYVFDCLNHKLVKTPYKHVLEAQRLYFSEGLAAFGASTRRGAIEGYIDSTGTFVIKEGFENAGPFMKGVASVTRLNGGSKAPKRVVINRKGTVVSPPNLEVQEFYGDFAVASKVGDQPPRFGVVNRKFQFVIEPKYRQLSPQPVYDFSSLDSPGHWFANSPWFYIAVENEGEQQKLISVKNEILATLPKGYFFNFLESNGKMACYVPKIGKVVHINMLGEPVQDAGEKNEGGQSIFYREIAPGRLLKTVVLDQGKFDAGYWKNGHARPISRRAMFGRFLNDFNLIGMSREELVGHLGNMRGAGEPVSRPDEYCFSLDFRCCVDQIPNVVIHLNNNKVDSWCFSQGNKRTQPVTINVVFSEALNSVWSTDEQMLRTKPK